MTSEIIVESLSLVVYTAIAGILTTGGVVAEYSSLQHFGSGEATVAMWLAAIGSVMLYAGAYGLGYQKILSEVV